MRGRSPEWVTQLLFLWIDYLSQSKISSQGEPREEPDDDWMLLFSKKYVIK